MTRADSLALMAAFFLATGDEKTEESALARAERLHMKAREVSKREWAKAIEAHEVQEAAHKTAGL